MNADPVDFARPRTSWAAVALLAVAIMAAYANTLSAPFVYDDISAIRDNPSIRRLWPLTPVLLPQVSGGLTVAGRPVLNLSFALNHAISGQDVWSYHVLNLAIHLGAALLVFGLVRRTVPRATGPAPAGAAWRDAPDAIALAIAALWALHPLQTQAVTYTVQRAESLMGFFYLLTLYAFARAVVQPTAEKRWLVLSVVAAALGTATKEVAATAPLLVFLYDRTFVAHSFRGAWHTRRGYYLALGATWLFLGALLWSTGGNRGGTVGLGVGVPWWAYPLTQFNAVAHYLRLAVWPHPLVFEYGSFWVQRAEEFVPHALGVLTLLGATAWALVKKPVLGFLGAWCFIILAPTSLAPGTIQMIVEHRMYLPLVAVVVFLTLAVQRVFTRRASLVCGVAAVGFGALTVARNHDYRSALSLWEITAAQRPDNPRAHENLAAALAAVGRLDEALAHRREVVRLKPDEGKVHYNLALTLAQTGRWDEAIRSYEFSLRLEPDSADAHNNLAIALVHAGRVDAALPHYAAAEQLRPADALFAYNHGLALLRLNRTADAATHFESALRLRPGYADAHFNLGAMQLRLGRIDDAAAHFAATLQLRPADAEAHSGLGDALVAGGRPDEALAHYEAALHLAPNLGRAHFKLGNALIATGRIADARDHYESAVRLTPDDAEAHHNLGIAYARLERLADAGREFATALRLKPDYAEAAQHLDQVRELVGPAPH